MIDMMAAKHSVKCSLHLGLFSDEEAHVVVLDFSRNRTDSGPGHLAGEGGEVRDSPGALVPTVPLHWSLQCHYTGPYSATTRVTVLSLLAQCSKSCLGKG